MAHCRGWIKVIEETLVELPGGANETLGNIEMNLPAGLFIRTHKSYIVSIKAIRYIEGNQLMVDNTPVPIGLTYKDELINRFNA